MVIFQLSFRKCPENGPQTGGEKVKFNVFFLTWMHFGRQGLPMELAGDFQEYFYMISTQFGDNLGRGSNEMTEKEEQWMTTPSTMRQVGTHWR